MAATRNPSTRLRDLVDQLGNINAEVALLEKQATTIKAELCAAGLEVIEGSIFRARVSASERAYFDSAKATKMLNEVGLPTPLKLTFVQSVRVYDIAEE